MKRSVSLITSNLTTFSVAHTPLLQLDSWDDISGQERGRLTVKMYIETDLPNDLQNLMNNIIDSIITDNQASIEKELQVIKCILFWRVLA